MDIGIIGGADGPTAIYVSSGEGSFIIAAAVIVCIAAFLIIRRAKKRKKDKR
jgi:Na+-transporting methylmalonyl-CoA/oxaloacetate decarboxylase beta subunit